MPILVVNEYLSSMRWEIRLMDKPLIKRDGKNLSEGLKDVPPDPYTLRTFLSELG